MSAQPLKILVYSHRPEIREAIITAVGRRPAPDIGRVDYVEADNVADVLMAMDAGGIDLAILDGEAVPAGGMGIARQLKDEIFQCPPIMIITGRPQDAWLATWSRAEGVISHPIDPVRTAEVTADLLRQRLNKLPATTA